MNIYPCSGEVTVFRLKRWIGINWQECSFVARLTYCCHHITSRGHYKVRRTLEKNSLLPPLTSSDCATNECLFVFPSENLACYSRDVA